ncbi:MULTISPECIES: cytochrome c biogenesis protein CcsA [unclassified Helicobacter]|uniref:cytochrome c biogenesis protein CcsA n=1 Tax=unclassified Helicobacter TaxID=2593540 RepID=UPI000CF188EF|nr:MULTISPECIES: cytochrome c biogenesis protein CcsA [unclassified Helicobacter]
MNFIKIFFTSFWIILPLIAVYITACGIATFIENDYGIGVANAVVYRTWWFNLLHIYFAIAVIATLFKFKQWKRRKYANLLLHLSFVFIIIGAGITRFFSFEGMMHIREGDTSSYITASESTLNIFAIKNKEKQFGFLEIPLVATSKNFSKKQTIEFFGKDLVLSNFKVKKLNHNKKDDALEISFSAEYDGVNQSFNIVGGKSIDSKFDRNYFKDIQFFINWGPRTINLPFQIKLNQFVLDRYPGSHSPSSYASEVEILDDQNRVIKPYRIYMNNVLDFDGYRFYQSSYDSDEKGTILSVNKDPGKNMTYLGYIMLILGAIGLLFEKNGRFVFLLKSLQKQKIDGCATVLLCLFFISFGGQKLFASEISPTSLQDKIQFIDNFKQKSEKHVDSFASIQLQNMSGRVEPIDTIANNIVHKITKKNNFMGMSNNQMFLGMMLYSDIWKDLRIIYVGNEQIGDIIGLSKKDKYASLSDFFSDKIGYKLNNFVEDANRIDPARRTTFEKELLKVDERVSLAYSIFSGSFLRIFPSESGDKWLDPIGISQQQNKEMIMQVSLLLKNFSSGFDKGLSSGDWGDLDRAISDIKEYQKSKGEAIYLPEKKVKAEIFLNQSNFFGKLILPYLVLGALLFVYMICCIFKDNKVVPWVSRGIYALMVVCVVFHTSGLLLRWYVSDHSPWSNAYESMLYITWASAFAGVAFFRRYDFALSASMLLSGIGLFVANLGFMDPQITPLVPVLKSYWLNIHVSTIMSGYAFLGLCFILGVMTLVFFIFRKSERNRVDRSIISLHLLNEVSMILGVLMLTVGNFLGAVWANESWGRYWSWDPKETWALVSIGVYAIILHFRMLGIKSSYFFASASVIGFYSILMTYFGVNYYLSGMHSYAAGDPLPIPTFVYYFTGAMILLIIVAGTKKKGAPRIN